MDERSRYAVSSFSAHDLEIRQVISCLVSIVAEDGNFWLGWSVSCNFSVTSLQSLGRRKDAGGARFVVFPQEMNEARSVHLDDFLPFEFRGIDCRG